MEKVLKVGLWGCGGIAPAHQRAYEWLEDRGVPVKLVALCDINPEQFNKDVKINISRGDEKPLKKIDRCYTDIDEMMANEELDIIDICLPVFLHKDAIIKSLNKGYNVICEKPMSLSTEECNEIIDAAKSAKGKAIIGQCIRFNAFYKYVRELIESNKYGKAFSASFHRLSPVPVWRGDRGKLNHGGGVNFDLTIHDIDYVNSIFGMPDKLSCINTGNERYTGEDTGFTTLVYNDGMIVNVRGDWNLPQKFKFDYGFRINFDHAALELKDEKLYLITDEVNEEVDIDTSESHIAAEIHYLVDCIINDCDTDVATLQSTADTIKIEEYMQKSSAMGGKFVEIK